MLGNKSQKNIFTGKNDVWAFTLARNCLVEIIYEQFRTSHELPAKQTLLEEMRKLQDESVNEALRDIDPEESSSAIVYACMLRKIGSNVEYEEVLNRVFDSCLTALGDANGGNDLASLILLAKVLACVPGLNKEARIAYSAQYSIVDQKIALTGPDGKIGLRSGSKVMENGSDYGGVDRELLTSNDELVNQEEKGKDVSSQAKERYKYVSHSQWGDILPCNSIVCAGNPEHKIVHWERVPTYLCVICTNTQLCAECYANIQLLNQGRKSWDDIGGRRYCGRDHRYIKGPIEGWRGIRDSYLVISGSNTEDRVLFKDWLKNLEKRWRSAWERFWTQEDFDNVLS